MLFPVQLWFLLHQLLFFSNCVDNTKSSAVWEQNQVNRMCCHTVKEKMNYQHGVYPLERITLDKSATRPFICQFDTHTVSKLPLVNPAVGTYTP